jgi:hypothetical protein
VPVIAATVLAGCSSSESQASSSADSRTTLPVRTCSTSVSGALPHGWKRSSVRAGSVWIYLWGAVQNGGRTGLLRASRFAAVSPGMFHEWKTMVVVPAGHSVIVRVAPISVAHLRLAFQLPTHDPTRLAAGQIGDRFVPCAAGRTYFNGGLIVAGAQCAHLEVSGTAPTPLHVIAALGRSRCT